MSSATRPSVLLVGLGLELSGSGRFLSGLAGGLARDGWRVGLFVVRGGALQAGLADAGVAVTVADDSLGTDAGRVRLGLASLSRLRTHIRRERPDIVHTNLIGVDFIGRVAATGTRPPVLMSTQHDINPRPWVANEFRRLTVGRIAATVARSASVADYCRETMHVPPERLFVVDNGIDATGLARVPRPPRPPRAFLAMGPLLPPKGHGALIESFARVVAQHPDSTLTIAGDGPLRGELKAQVASLGLGRCVRIVRPTPDIELLFGEADVFVQPSLREGLPQAMLEAMATAMPVVATDVSSHAEVLDGGSCGLLVTPNDTAALAEGMLTALARPTDMAAMGERARQRVLAHYSLERMVGEYEALYERLFAAAR